MKFLPLINANILFAHSPFVRFNIEKCSVSLVAGYGGLIVEIFFPPYFLGPTQILLEILITPESSALSYQTRAIS